MNLLKLIFITSLLSCNHSINEDQNKTEILRDSFGKVIKKTETGLDPGPFKNAKAENLPFKITTYFDSSGRPIKIESIKYGSKTLETFNYKNAFSTIWMVSDLGSSSDTSDSNFAPASNQLSLLKEQRLNSSYELIYEYTESIDSSRKCSESIYDTLTGSWIKTVNCR